MVYAQLTEWAQEFQPDFGRKLTDDPDYAKAILAIGRIVGESAALLFTAGSAKALPKTFAKLLEKIFHSGGTLTIQLYLSATADGDFTTAFGIAVVLLVLVLCINLTAKKLASKLDPTRRK